MNGFVYIYWRYRDVGYETPAHIARWDSRYALCGNVLPGADRAFFYHTPRGLMDPKLCRRCVRRQFRTRKVRR